MTAAQAKRELVLLPSAGGSAAMFAAWSGLGDALGVGVRPMELAGRGSRIAERPHGTIDAVVDELVAHTPSADWIVYGHSFGALLAVEWAARAEQAGHGPSLVIVSGAAPPWVHSTARVIDGPIEDLWERVGRLGGVQARLVDNPAARRILGRAMAADVAAAAAFHPQTPTVVAAPLVSVHGEDDPLVSTAHGAAWRSATSGRFRHIVVPGGHFFTTGIDDVLPLVTDLVRGDLNRRGQA